MCVFTCKVCLPVRCGDSLSLLYMYTPATVYTVYCVYSGLGWRQLVYNHISCLYNLRTTCPLISITVHVVIYWMYMVCI